MAGPFDLITRAFRGRALIVAGVAGALLVGGLTYLGLRPTRVTTDNAYLRSDAAQIAPKLKAFVVEVAVKDNQRVRAGDLLVRLDETDYQIALRLAEADLARAKASADLARAALSRNGAEQSLAQASMREAEGRILAADAERRRSERDQERYRPLQRAGFASEQKLDAATSASISAGAEATRARAGLDVARAQSLVTAKRADELLAQVADADAVEARARAARDQALSDLAHTRVTAPFDGVVGDRKVEVGDFLQPGTRILQIVPDTLYVVANFKETQTEHMRVGQTAMVEVDALGGRALKARVESLSPATGAAFALLPFEPGTGNFTKIVQRVPVRLELEASQADPALRAGLSANVTVTLKD